MPQERFKSSHALSEGDHPLGGSTHPLPAPDPAPPKLQIEPYEPGVNPALPEEWAGQLEEASPGLGGPAATPFDSAFKETVLLEGGYVDHEADRGGRTNFGLSERAHPDLWADGKVPDITTAHSVYKTEYWDRVGGDDLSVLSPALASVVFDAAVHHGPGTAAKMLQRAVGARPDGIVGPATLAAAGKHGQAGHGAAIEGILTAREELFYSIIANDPSQKVFEQGWRNRLLKLRDLYLGD